MPAKARTRPNAFRFFFPTFNSGLTFEAHTYQEAEALCRDFLHRCGPPGQAILSGISDVIITINDQPVANAA